MSASGGCNQALPERGRPDNADPPYLLDTRKGSIFQNEMSNEDHSLLLDTLDVHNGPVILSGYAHKLYETRLKHWQREEQKQIIENGTARTEVLWINPIAADKGGNQMQLF